MNQALPALPRRWWAIELPGYRAHPDRYRTYSAFDYEGLPPVGRELDPELAWLLQAPIVDGSLADRAQGDPEPVREATRGQLDLLAGQAHLEVPAAFQQFVASDQPRRRVRSATACYLDLAAFVVPVVGGGALIHFLSDQQWALHWLLFSAQDGDEAVIVTEDPIGFAEDNFDPDATNATVCAESFSEFLYRFWIENEIWFALMREGGGDARLSDEQTRYVAHYRRPT